LFRCSPPFPSPWVTNGQHNSVILLLFLRQNFGTRCESAGRCCTIVVSFATQSDLTALVHWSAVLGVFALLNQNVNMVLSASSWGPGSPSRLSLNKTPRRCWGCTRLVEESLCCSFSNRCIDMITGTRSAEHVAQSGAVWYIRWSNRISATSRATGITPFWGGFSDQISNFQLRRMRQEDLLSGNSTTQGC
jgi:hypothetical protein